MQNAFILLLCILGNEIVSKVDDPYLGLHLGLMGDYSIQLQYRCVLAVNVLVIQLSFLSNIYFDIEVSFVASL